MEKHLTKNIDIIIPCYNSLKTLFATLSSIAIQSIKDQCNIYICDDCGTDNYGNIINIFSSMLDITYLRLDKNCGVGMARQYGLDHSQNDYVIFIDSDDTFNGAFAIELLYQGIKNNDCDMVSGKFVNDDRSTDKLFLTSYEKQLTWLHGKMYSRKFIEEHNIKFPNLRLNEDGVFNQCFALQKARIRYIDQIVYNWTTNKDSLTRISNPFTRFNILKSYIDGSIETYKYGSSHIECDKKILITQASHALVLIYFYYNEIASTLSEDLADDFMNKCREYYLNCYRFIQNEIDDIDLRTRYCEILSSSEYYRGYFPVITFYDFCMEIGKI